MKYGIVSTYPASGSQNIGDALITSATQEFILNSNKKAEFQSLWRAAPASQATKFINTSDHIIFACLAIRGNMKETYSFIDMVLKSNTPFSIIAAGTSLDLNNASLEQLGFGKEDKEILLQLAEKSVVFSSRGLLTQSFLESQGIEKSNYCGDVAFGVNGTPFQKTTNVRKIVISDPHYPGQYKQSLIDLIKGLKGLFPEADIQCALHGINEDVKQVCKGMNIKSVSIYDDPNRGLEIYDDCDLHVGFRVHGHVSALSRGKPSYLLEQDGRGADYGLSLGLRISTPCFNIQRSKSTQLRSIFNRGMNKQQPIKSAVPSMLAMISHHSKTDFQNFLTMSPLIDEIRKLNKDLFDEVCA